MAEVQITQERLSAAIAGDLRLRPIVAVVARNGGLLQPLLRLVQSFRGPNVSRFFPYFNVLCIVVSYPSPSTGASVACERPRNRATS